MSLVDPIVESAIPDETVPAETQDQNAKPAESQIDESIPEKFRGKSLVEVVQSYQNLETELGRARNEIGTSRRVLDELLALRRQPEKSESVTAKPITPHELAENPEEVITEVAKREADKRTSQAEQRLAQLEANLASQNFEKKHPGFKDVVQSTKFVEWVQQSPVRVNLTVRAAQQDWDAADELMGLYKEYEAIASSRTQNSSAADKTEEARKASLAKPGGSGANKVVSSGDGKRIYKRTELARLYIDNPTEYDRLYQEDLQLAYQEGRVK